MGFAGKLSGGEWEVAVKAEDRGREKTVGSNQRTDIRNRRTES